MKTTVEIPDDLFRHAKARAALEGIRLRDLVERGLRLALGMPLASTGGQRAAFPLIRTVSDAPALTDEQVAAALATMDGEDAQRHASFMRR